MHSELQLRAHLESAFHSTESQPVTLVRILRWADGRSRGCAKVVMATAADAVAVIERLDRAPLADRPLTICHDRLRSAGRYAPPPNPYWQNDDFEEADPSSDEDAVPISVSHGDQQLGGCQRDCRHCGELIDFCRCMTT